MLELLRGDHWHPLEIGVSHDLPDECVREVQAWAHRRHCPVERWNDKELAERCRAQDHQGLIARMPEFPYRRVDEVLSELAKDSWCVLLDGIQDPFNFGAIIRSAEVLGAKAVLVGRERQCGVTAQVVRSSAGAVLHVPLAQGERVLDIARAVQARGYQICGASEKATLAPDQVRFTQPTCLVIGNEGSGLSDQMLSTCQSLVAIPQYGQVGSLNAAVAAGILFYEVARQRRG